MMVFYVQLIHNWAIYIDVQYVQNKGFLLGLVSLLL